MATHVRRFDRAMSDTPPGDGAGVLEALCDHLTHAHTYPLTVDDVADREEYAVVQLHENLHARGHRHAPTREDPR